MTAITNQSPAGSAGIKVNDIIVAIDGVPIRNSIDFTSYIGEFKSPDGTSTLNVIRDFSTLELPVKIGKWQQ